MPKKHTPLEIQNSEHCDVSNANITKTAALAKKITVSGANTYIASAVVGSAQASAVWQIKKITVSGVDTIITWCDGDQLFNNVATDLTTLTYL